MKKILFNDIYNSFNYTKNLELLFSDYELFREKYFSGKCLHYLSNIFKQSELFLTHSATGALEMIASLIDIKPGDEVIMPSFTYVSTANAFVSKGATPIFVDIETESLNLDIDLIEQAITVKTKAIVAVHYAGNPCNLLKLKEICTLNNLYLIEDAAMAYGNYYQNLPLGSFGDFGVISFDITKQISAIQGGLLIVNNGAYKQRAQQIYHIGTNRTDFQSHKVPYYEWVDIGSKYQMNELNAMVLYEQLQNENTIISARKAMVKYYYKKLKPLADKNCFKLIGKNFIDNCLHEFYLILNNQNDRDLLCNFLSKYNIQSMFHYIPLHTSQMGKKIAKYHGGVNTENIAGQILRLPLNTKLNLDDIDFIVKKINDFFYGK